MNPLADVDLQKLLEVCVNPKNEYYQQGWYEFDSRYRKLILGKIFSITKNKESVNDITQMVMDRLIAKDFRALKNFRAKESDAAFRAFISVVSRMTTFAHLSKTSKEVELDGERDIISPDDRNEANGMHEKVVKSLRDILYKTSKNDYNIERDILIFTLRKLHEIEAKEVAKIPLLNIEAGNVDNVVNRLLNKLKNNRDDLRDFLS